MRPEAGAHVRPGRSHKIEFSFLNGNLMVPANHQRILFKEPNTRRGRVRRAETAKR
jgi:hypothetical protein